MIWKEGIFWSLILLCDKRFSIQKHWKQCFEKQKMFVWHFGEPPSPPSVTYYLNDPLPTKSHGPESQIWVSISIFVSLQFKPSSGLKQVLVRVWLPSPHSASHEDHSDQSAQVPSNNILINNNYFQSFKNDSLIVIRGRSNNMRHFFGTFPTYHPQCVICDIFLFFDHKF